MHSDIVGAFVHRAVYSIILCMIAALCLTIQCMFLFLALETGAPREYSSNVPVIDDTATGDCAAANPCEIRR